MSKKRVRNDEEDHKNQAPKLKLPKVDQSQHEVIFKLFDEGNTIPFLARYRKEIIGNLTPDDLRQLHEEYEGKK